MTNESNSTAAPSADTQTARIFAWRRGFNAMHLIDLGERLGLWQALADAPDATPADLAARLGAELSQPLLVLPARGEKPEPRRISLNPSTVQVTAYKQIGRAHV